VAHGAAHSRAAQESTPYRRNSRQLQQKAKSASASGRNRFRLVNAGGGVPTGPPGRAAKAVFDDPSIRACSARCLTVDVLRVDRAGRIRGEDMDVPMRYMPGGPPDRYRPRRPVTPIGPIFVQPQQPGASWPGI